MPRAVRKRVISMLANSNHKIISRMAGNSVRKNRGRNGIIFLSIVLASFMLFSIFTAGILYFKMYRIQNIRLNGGEYDAVLYGVTEEQREKCEADPDIIRAGVIALSGYIESTEMDDTVEISCIWADEVCWNEIMEPARKWMKGTYPKAENEVMAAEKCLEEAGLEGKTIGDTFSAGYRDAEGKLVTKEFTISGLWEGYGAEDALYVSEAFYRASGFDISEVRCGRYQLDFGKWIMTEEEQSAFTESLALGKQQAVIFTGDMGYSLPIFLGLCALVFVTCLCAYLLIYNILYLSVSRNVRYYGLLQTVGMTGRQIRLLIRKEMLLLGGLGTAGGILAGCAVSFGLIPSVIRSLGIRDGTAGEIRVSLNPAVLALTVLLTAFTIAVGSRKPAKLAAEIPPIEAAGYRPVYMEHAGRRRKRRRRGGLLWRMDMDQIRKDKKKSAVIIASLAAGLSVFLCLSTLLESQGARTIVTNHMNNDITIVNDTLKKENSEEHRQLLADEFLDRLEKIQGVERIYPILYSQITVPWEPEFADLWMEEFYAKWMDIPYEDDIEEYKEHPENFGAVMIGISKAEFPYLQQTLETEIDEDDFLAGKTCVLYRNGLDLTSDDVSGKEVICAEYGNEQNSRAFRIAGMTDEGYYSGPVQGFPPTVIISSEAMERFTEKLSVSKVGAAYAEEYDEETEHAVTGLIQSSPYADDFSWESKLEAAERVEKAQGNMKEVGLGIALILALIGILNYMNSVMGNIQSRQMELAVLESVGMTDRQRNRLLVTEGLLFAAGSLLVTATVGLGITYVVYQSMNYMQVPFMVPAGPVVGMVGAVIIICVAIPLAAGAGMIQKGSVVERMRGV